MESQHSPNLCNRHPHPTIIFISISKFAIFKVQIPQLLVHYFKLVWSQIKAQVVSKKRRFTLIKCEERCLQTGASSAWGPRGGQDLKLSPENRLS